MAFARTVSFIENGLNDGTFIFKMSDVHRLCQEYLKDLGVDFNINKTRLKRELLELLRHQLCKNNQMARKFFWYSLKACMKCVPMCQPAIRLQV